MLQKQLIIILMIFSLNGITYQDIIRSTPDASTLKYEEKLFETVERISHHLEKFNLHYLTKLEDKFLNIMQTMNTLDMNIKLLQEKAQVWDIFRHHIDSWSQHMKSVDQKIEILKKSQDRVPIIENQIQSMDFKVQHIFEKVDLLNEKFHDLTKTIYTSNQHKHTSRKVPSTSKNFNIEGQEEFEQTEILMRLHTIQKLLQQTQRHNHPMYGHKYMKNVEVMKSSKLTTETPTNVSDLKSILIKISTNIDKLPIREIKQSFNLNRKQEKSMESLTEILNHIDERTTRIFDTNSYQFRTLLNCCKSTEHEIMTFTSSGDTLLKRTEKIMRHMDDKLVSVLNGKCEIGNRTEIDRKNVDLDVDKTIFEGESGSASGEDNAGEDAEDETNFFQPKKTHCFQITSGTSGVYTFGYDREFNDGGRDFLQQYCDFTTDGGPAWTVIQRRGDFEHQENFNRSWNEYKYGFGNLSNDFWFGNDFIHKLTYEDNMILRIELENFDGVQVWVEYGLFRVESEKFKYNLIINEYRGSVPDSFLYHNDMDFSTFDKNNDKVNTTCCPCALSLGSGWWFNNCAESNLNGIYQKKPKDNNFTGIFWEHWLGDYSLKATKMMVRPKDVWFTSATDEDFIELPKSITEEP